MANVPQQIARDGRSEPTGTGVPVSRLHRPGLHWPVAFLLAGFYVVTSLYIAAHRLLWYDEIFTAITARLPDVHTIWKAVCEGAEQLPLLYYLIVRVFDRLLGHADIGVRVPSALALGAGLLCIFDVARRLTDGLYGLIALSFATTSFVVYYGYEARPYALGFLFASLALWLWVATQDESRVAAIAFGLLFFIAGGLHCYFLLCLVPFGIMALVQRRILHPKVVAATVGALGALAMLYPQIRSLLAMSGAQNFGTWAEPSLSRLQAVYLDFFAAATIPMVIIALGVAIFGQSRQRFVAALQPGEVISRLFLIVPLAGYIAARLVTHVFVDRYMIVAIPGIVVAATCLFWRYCRESSYLSLAILTAFGGFGIYRQLQTLRHIDHIPAYGDQQEDTRQILAIENTLLAEGKNRFAVRPSTLYLQSWYYSKRRDQYVYAAPLWARPGWGIKNYAAITFVSVEEIVSNPGRVAIIAPEPGFAEELQRAGLRLRIRFVEPYVLYVE